MKRSSGALAWGASFFSFLSRGGRKTTRPQCPGTIEAKELFALVQTRPEPVVLAISETRKDLERELAELNRTWNHWAFRSERRTFEVQRAPLLATAVGGAAGRVEARLQRRPTSFQRKL